jgi:hypothetical protein
MYFLCLERQHLGLITHCKELFTGSEFSRNFWEETTVCNHGITKLQVHLSLGKIGALVTYSENLIEAEIHAFTDNRRTGEGR